jgi:TfoX N-terminal domain
MRFLMAFDEGLAHRLEGLLGQNPNLTETRMFGGFGCMMGGNMLLGIHKDQLIIRLGIPAATALLKEEHVHPMDITGRPMKGWARIVPAGTAEDTELKRFCDLALDFVSTLPPKKKKPKKVE